MSLDDLEYMDIPNELKKIITNYVNSYTICKEHDKLFENINDKKIIIDHQIKNNKTSLQIYNCKNCTIIIDRKINHITINRCENIALIINAGVISGIDIIHSGNIVCYSRNHIYFLGCGSSHDIVMVLNEKFADNTLIQTTECFQIDIKLIHNGNIIVHRTNRTLFSAPMLCTIMNGKLI